MTSFFQLLRKSPTMMVGFVIVLMVVIVGVFAPWLAPKDPNTTSLFDRVKPPSKEYPFGTDNLGRDLLSRIIWGTRVSLQVGVISVSIGMALGVLLGVLAGYYGGRLDLVISAAMDLLLSFPAILLAIAMVAALGPGIVQVMVAVGISLVPNFARITRGSVLAIRSSEFVMASRGLGASNFWIITRHVLPNILTPIVVLATLNAAFAIIMEAGLSFLGIGVQPPDPTWGSILSEGRSHIVSGPWISISSGVAISITVLGLNMLGDGLRDLLDPRMKRLIR